MNILPAVSSAERIFLCVRIKEFEVINNLCNLLQNLDKVSGAVYDYSDLRYYNIRCFAPFFKIRYRKYRRKYT